MCAPKSFWIEGRWTMVDEAKKTHVELQVSASRHKTSWSDECHRPSASEQGQYQK
jgi:hypothetical protein